LHACEKSGSQRRIGSETRISHCAERLWSLFSGYPQLVKLSPFLWGKSGFIWDYGKHQEEQPDHHIVLQSRTDRGWCCRSPTQLAWGSRQIVRSAPRLRLVCFWAFVNSPLFSYSLIIDCEQNVSVISESRNIDRSTWDCISNASLLSALECVSCFRFKPFNFAFIYKPR
jgi:hypothetical protein